MPASTGKASLEAIVRILDGTRDFKALEQKCFALGMAPGGSDTRGCAYVSSR